MMKTLSGICCTLLVVLCANQAWCQTAKIVSGSTGFNVKFILGTCEGTFDGPKGTVIFDEKKPQAASLDITVAAASFKTNNNSRDKDMKSDKYFFVEKYPDIHFRSSQVERRNEAYQATGKLTIRDVSKTVTLPFEAKKNADGTYSLSSNFQVNRIDYNIGEKDWKLKDIVTVTLKAIIK